MTAAINAIGANLSSVVGKVRLGADQIAHASQEISAGNLDLCQNADNARQANTLAFTASTVAQKGGDTVAQVIERMDSAPSARCDESTQQNAALVEQASTAAQATHDQAAELAHAVRVFRLSENGAGPASPARTLLPR